MALDAADHADIMKLSLEERVAQRVKDVKTMTKRPYAPAADPLPPKNSENRFAAPTNSFALGSAERPRRRKPRARATNDLNDVWASLDQLNEAEDTITEMGDKVATLERELAAAKHDAEIARDMVKSHVAEKAEIARDLKDEQVRVLGALFLIADLATEPPKDEEDDNEDVRAFYAAKAELDAKQAALKAKQDDMAKPSIELPGGIKIGF